MKTKYNSTVFVILIAIVLISYVNLKSESNQAFNYDSYQVYSFDKIIALTNDYLSKFGKRGATHYCIKYRLKIKVDSYPVKISKGSLNILDHYKRLYSLPASYIDLFQYELNIIINNKKFCFLMQKNIVPFFLKEVKLGSDVDLYAIFGFFNSFDEVHTLLVNEFGS